jgi:hypothetical protein
MITTEFGRLVATGGAAFAFLFLMSYLRLRRIATRPTTKATTPPSRAREVWGAQVVGRAR